MVVSSSGKYDEENFIFLSYTWSQEGIRSTKGMVVQREPEPTTGRVSISYSSSWKGVHGLHGKRSFRKKLDTGRRL